MISVIAPIVDWAYFSDHTYTKWVSWAGLIMIAIGIAFRALSVRTLGKHFTATVQLKHDHQLIINGPYSIVRHPSYLGALLAIVGSAVYLNSLIGVIISCTAMMIAYYIRIKVEEEALISMFGDRYHQYSRTTKKLIPFLW